MIPTRNLPVDKIVISLVKVSIRLATVMRAMLKPTVAFRPILSRRAPDKKGPRIIPRDNIEATVLPWAVVSGSFTRTGEDHANPIPHIR